MKMKWGCASAMVFMLGTTLAGAQAPAPQRPPDPDRFKPTTRPIIHDPSTVIQWKGKYYVYGTGRGITVLSSPDSVTWTREPSVFTTIPEAVHAAVPKNNGTDVWAPDIVRLNGLFYLYYAISSWGSFNSAVALATSPSLDPKDPEYKWTDRGVVVRSDGVENLNAIDPGVMLAPDGKMWLCYGSYHGTIQLIELNPKTGLRIKPDSPVLDVANGSESSDIIFHDGYYYLFVNHGSCCKGKTSTYTIRMGRSRKVTGPYLDRFGETLMKAPGELFLATQDHRVGPGHFGLLVEDGAERFSLHYEADLENNGRSTLDLRPLLWAKDGWPVAGDHLAEGVYRIRSRKTENDLDLNVPVAPAQPGATAVSGAPAAPGPKVHLAMAGLIDTEHWKMVPAEGGSMRIEDVATGEALESSSSGAIEAGAATGAETQLWKLDQLPDGTYRIRNKANGLALTAAGEAVKADKFTSDDNHKWVIAAP